MAGLDCWHESQKGIKRQRKPFLVLELNWLTVKFQVIFSPNVSYVQCFSASQSPFLGIPLEQHSFEMESFSIKGDSLHLSCLCLLFMASLVWSDWHSITVGISPYQSAVLFFCGIFLTWTPRHAKAMHDLWANLGIWPVARTGHLVYLPWRFFFFWKYLLPKKTPMGLVFLNIFAVRVSSLQAGLETKPWSSLSWTSLMHFKNCFVKFNVVRC